MSAADVLLVDAGTQSGQDLLRGHRLGQEKTPLIDCPLGGFEIAAPVSMTRTESGDTARTVSRCKQNGAILPAPAVRRLPRDSYLLAVVAQRVKVGVHRRTCRMLNGFVRELVLCPPLRERRAQNSYSSPRNHRQRCISPSPGHRGHYHRLTNVMAKARDWLMPENDRADCGRMELSAIALQGLRQAEGQLAKAARRISSCATRRTQGPHWTPRT